MKYIVILLFFFNFSIGQTEQVNTITFGGNFDYTNVPINPNVEFSRSQTIYYPSQLTFRGNITQIRYNKSFTDISLANSTSWIVRLGVTNLQDFGTNEPFIASSTLTEVFNGTISSNLFDVIITFNQPFYYNGVDNLVIEVQEVGAGFTSDATIGFTGNETYNTAPNRSKIAFSGSTGNAVIHENSYPQTKFYGTLERCLVPAYFGNPSSTQNSATITYNNNPAVSSYSYVVYPEGTLQPPTLETTTQNTVTIQNLTAAERYTIASRTNCDTPIPRFNYFNFRTKPLVLSVPHQINFDGENTRDYLLSPTLPNYTQPEISTVAGNNSSHGILFRGILANGASVVWSNNNIWVNNQAFIGKASFIVDLTNNPLNPVLNFDLKQKSETYVRVKINNLVKTWTYTSAPGGDLNFRKISIDLSNYVGQIIDFEIEHLSSYTSANGSRTSYVDNIELKESTCYTHASDYTLTETQNAITLNSQDNSTLYDVAIIPFESTLSDLSWIAVTLPYQFENLTPGKAYKVYVRKKCIGENDAFKELLISTLPVPIPIPFSDDFSQQQLSQYFAPVYNSSSTISLNTVYNFVNMHQRQTGDVWYGGDNTTEAQAWNENKPFVSTLKFIIDATSASSVNLGVNFKLSRFYPSNSSWFRIMINGNQIGTTYVPGSLDSDPFLLRTFDLTNYVGNLITVELQHCGRQTNFVNNGINDAAYITSVNVTGVLGNNNFESSNFKMYPNPAEDYLNIESDDEITQIKIFSLEGKEIYSETINSNTARVFVGNFDIGTYVIQLNDESTKRNKLFFKSN